MDTGDSLFGQKIRSEKSKTRSSKKERSLSSKQDRGDDTTSRRSRRSHRSVTGERRREKEPVDKSLLSLLDGESQRRSKKNSPEKRNRRDRSDSLPKKKEASGSRQARSKSSHRKPKSSSRRPRSVTKDRSENMLKTAAKDVKFDTNAKSNENMNVGDKSVLNVKRKSESRDKSSKSKSGDRREKSGVSKTDDRHKDKKESRTRRDKSGDQSKIRIRTKDRSDAVPQESIKEKHLKERDKSEKRKEKIHKERRDKKRAEEDMDIIDSITIICRPEKKRKSRRSAFFEEEIKSAYELPKKKDHGEKEVKRNKENKDEHKERKRRRISEKLEGRQSEKSSSRRSEKRAGSRSERPENPRSEKTEKRSENPRTEKRESRRVVKLETSQEKLDRHLEKRSSRRSEKTDAEREERKRRKSKPDEVEGSGSRERKRKVRQKEQCNDEASEETGAAGDFRKQSKRPDDNQRETNVELVESCEEPSEGQFKEAAPTCKPRSQIEEAELKQIKGNHKDLSAKPIETDKSTRNVLKPDKYIKITNKEDILRKGVQDLTVKELYLMENLKDYEIKMNEQFLRKIKKKKQEQQSVSDNVSRQHFRQESSRHSLTNMSIYRLPSVKEIFKISNLVDYEKKCKEMRERKKRKCTDTRTDPDFGYLTSLGRKKLTKFSLESKEDEARNKKKDASKLSSQWILNNFRRTTVKNEGGGEEIICNLSLILDNENKKQEKNLETGDARGPNRVREITRGLRTTSKTKLAIREVSRYSYDLEENANYFKMCENFRHNIREESKRLLQNMAENKNVRISIKDSSLQSIKKKPSLQSDDTLGALDSRNFDYVLLKKSKQNLEEGYSFMSGDTRKKFEMCDDAVCERLNRKEETNDEISWNVVSRRHEFDPNKVPRAFEKNVNKNAGVFINNHHKPEFVPPGNLIAITSKYQPEQFSSEGNYSSYTADYNLNRALSNSSYTLSMFERDRDPSDPHNSPHRHPVDSNLNHCNISREDPEMSLSRRRDLTELKPDDDAWFHRSYTLERIISEIEDSPEKDTDPPSKVLRECRFDNRCNQAFPEIEKSKNVLLNYVNGNPNAQAKEIDCRVFNEDKKNDHLVFSEFDDHLGKNKRCALKETKYRDSLSCLREIESFDRRRQTDSSLSSGKLEQYPCMVNGKSCVICSRSCVSIRTFRNENNRKPCRNILKASLHNSSATFKCDLKAEEEANMINTKLVITDPVAKRSNILQIQFCGKLNINFNKDNIELGNVNSVCCEHQKPVEIKYSDDSKLTCTRVEEAGPTALQPGPDPPLETSQSPPDQHVSQECVRQSSCNNVQLNRSKSQSSGNGSESSKTVILKEGGSEPPVGQQTKLIIDKDKQPEENNTSDDAFNSNSVSNSAEPKNDDIMDHSNTGGSEAQAVGSQPEEGNAVLTADGESKQTDDANGADVSKCEIEVKSLSETEGQEEKEVIAEDPMVESSATEAQDIGQELQLEPEAKTVVNEDSKEVPAENIVDASECDKILNLDASVQTVNSPRCDLTVFKKPSSTLGRNVQTCTSSIFEPKENAGNKNLNTCTYITVNDTPVISSSSVNMTSLNKEKEMGSQPPSFAEKPKGQILYEKKTARPPGANVNFKLPLPKITASKGNVASFDSESIVNNECEKRTPDVQNSNCSTVQNPLAKEIEQDKKFDEKKKLLLSQSEEDAFKYLLLKGIGRTEGCEGKSSEDTVVERSDVSQHPKFMLSAIKRRVEYYKNKASGSKLSDSSGESRANAANLVKSATVEDRRRCCWRPNEYSTCSCSRQRAARVWDHQRPKSRKQLFNVEPQFTHMPQGYGPLKPHSCRPPTECSTPGNMFYPRYSPDYRTTEQFEPKDQVEEMVEYNLKNLHSQAEKYRMRQNFATFNKFVHRQSPHESVFEPNCSGASTLQEHYKGENGKDVASANLHHGFCGRKVCEADKSIDLSSWGDNRRDYTGNASLPLINLPTNPSESSYCLFPQKSYPCEQVRSRFSDSIQSEQQVPPPTEPARQTLTDAVRQKDVDKQSCSTKLFVTDSLQETAHNDDSIVVGNMRSSVAQENTDQTQTNIINFLENKKQSTKIKFSKQASKLWKSLFKKNKRMNDDLLEYEAIAPEHFIAKRPKVQEKKLKITKWLKKISQGKTTNFQNVQDKLFKKLNKIMTSEVTMPLQEVFDLIQKPQFHKDNHSYSGRIKFDKVNTSNYLSDDGNYIMITEQLNVRGFLASIGLKDDVAWEAQDNPELNARLQSAITEARSWVNKITMSQGLLIYILAVMTPVEVNNYYLQIVEAIINNRISNVGTLLSVVMVLKRYERGKYGIKTVISKEHVKDLVPKQISDTEKRHLENRTRFINLYNIAKRAAGKINMKVDKECAGLLARLTASYSPGLKPYLSLLAHYIAQKIITDKGLLSMAVSYLQSLNVKHFDQETFEQHCGLAHKKVVFRGNTLKNLPAQEGQAIKHPERTNMPERVQASWVKRKKTRPPKDSTERIGTDTSILERKPSTMNLLKGQIKE